MPGGNHVLTEVDESKMFNPLEVKYQFQLSRGSNRPMSDKGDFMSPRVAATHTARPSYLSVKNMVAD